MSLLHRLDRCGFQLPFFRSRFSALLLLDFGHTEKHEKHADYMKAKRKTHILKFCHYTHIGVQAGRSSKNAAFHLPKHICLGKIFKANAELELGRRLQTFLSLWVGESDTVIEGGPALNEPSKSRVQARCEQTSH